MCVLSMSRAGPGKSWPTSKPYAVWFRFSNGLPTNLSSSCIVEITINVHVVLVSTSNLIFEFFTVIVVLIFEFFTVIVV